MMPPKMFDQNRFDLGVLQHDLESFGDLLGGGAAAHIEEVGRFCAKQLDGVHGGHGQTRTVDQATDVAVQRDVGQVELGGFHFRGVFFVEVTKGDDFGVAEQGVGCQS
jgi:hypothetical protein